MAIVPSTNLKTAATVLLLLITIFLTACTHDKEEILYPKTTICDTTNVRYSDYISVKIQNNCLSCHAGQALGGGGINFDNYTSLKAFLDDQKIYFISSLTHDGNAPEMPMSASKLDDCTITKFKIWIASGYPNN